MGTSMVIRFLILEEAARELPLYPQWPVTGIPNAGEIETLVSTSFTSFQSADMKRSMQALENLFLSHPDPPKALYELLGALYLREEMWVNALCLYGQGAHKYPDTLGLRYSALLYHLNQPEKAMQALSDMMIAADVRTETLAHAQYMLGSIHLEKQNYEKAVTYLKSAATTFNNNATVLYNLAIAYEGLNQHQLALEAYQQALRQANGNLSLEIQSQIQRLMHQSGVKFTDTPSKG